MYCQIKGSSEEIEELRNALADLSDQQDTFEAQIEELSNDIQSQNDQTNQDIGSLQEFDQTVTEDLNNLAGNIANLEEQTQQNVTAISQELEDHGVSIVKNTEDITQLQENLEAVENYDDLIQENSDNIATMEGEIGNITAQADENTNRIDVLEANNGDGTDLNERIGANEIRIDSLSATVDGLDKRINNTEAIVGNLSQELEELSNTVEQYDEQIDSLQVNMTEANSKIDLVEEHHKELRNDFEYLKYDFRSSQYEISKWQINVDERLNQTENQIQGNFCTENNDY